MNPWEWECKILHFGENNKCFGMSSQASSAEVKRLWVKKLREVIQETYFNTALRLSAPRSPSKSESGSHRSSRYVFHVCVLKFMYLKKNVCLRCCFIFILTGIWKTLAQRTNALK